MTTDEAKRIAQLLAQRAELMAAARAPKPGAAVTPEQGKRFADALTAIVYPTR